MDRNLGRRWEMVRDSEAWCAAGHESQRVGHNGATEQQQIKVVDSQPCAFLAK